MTTAPPGLPDPQDHSLAWWNDEPALYAWWRWAQDEGLNLSTVNDNYRIIARYSEAIPTKAVVQGLAALGPIIELGAGAGYWARLIKDVGGDVIATDVAAPEANGWYKDLAPWTDVHQSDALVAAERHPDRVIFSCWPPRGCNNYMKRVLIHAPQRTLALITDGRHDMGTDPMYDELERSWTRNEDIVLPTWPYRYDSLMIWRR